MLDMVLANANAWIAICMVLGVGNLLVNVLTHFKSNQQFSSLPVVLVRDDYEQHRVTPTVSERASFLDLWFDHREYNVANEEDDADAEEKAVDEKDSEEYETVPQPNDNDTFYNSSTNTRKIKFTTKQRRLYRPAQTAPPPPPSLRSAHRFVRRQAFTMYNVFRSLLSSYESVALLLIAYLVMTSPIVRYAFILLGLRQLIQLNNYF